MKQRARVMVVGADGQLGRQVVARLEAASWDVITSTENELDITEPQAVRERVRAVGPAWVVNCAGLTQVDYCQDHEEEARAVNACAVAHLAEACRAQDACLVQIGTDYIFDGRSNRPYREEDPAGPLSVYGRSKWEGEELTRTCPRHLIVRTAWLYGPGGRSFAATILARAAAGRPLRVVDDQKGSPTYAPDVAEGVERLMRLDAQGVFHMINAGEATWYEFACRAVELGGLNVSVTPISSTDYASPTPRPAYSVLDGAKYSALTSHQPRHWAAALEEFVRGGSWRPDGAE